MLSLLFSSHKKGTNNISYHQIPDDAYGSQDDLERTSLAEAEKL